MNLGRVLRQTSLKNPNDIAVVCGEDSSPSKGSINGSNRKASNKCIAFCFHFVLFTSACIRSLFGKGAVQSDLVPREFPIPLSMDRCRPIANSESSRNYQNTVRSSGKYVKILGWIHGPDGKRFGWKTVTMEEALESGDRHFRCAKCDYPVRIVNRKKSPMRQAHLKRGPACGLALVQDESRDSKA